VNAIVVSDMSIYHQLAPRFDCAQFSENNGAGVTTNERVVIDRDFLTELKHSTEKKWSTLTTDPSIYGFQFQRGTRWLPGLSEEQIAAYEDVLGTKFPNDFRSFLGAMNGTDLPIVNVYGSSGVPPRQSPGIYSYPRDVEIVKQLIEVIEENRDDIVLDLASQGFHLPTQARLVPIFGHLYLLCTKKLNTSVVLSVVVNDVDAIVLGNSLREYLMKDFLAANPKSQVRVPLEST
jgi:hypothetical protein